MDLLKSMDTQSMAHVLRETNFIVGEHLVAQGRAAVFESVKSDLQAALTQALTAPDCARWRLVLRVLRLDKVQWMSGLR
ncbi:hypothetical protein AU476_00855 [Cupriavidus sp. UYMSc13B]|nr:hypothetical protein AU476_00855 [Cupriavidus sp. UYMSc13B]